MRLLYVTNVAWFFRSHRLPIAIEAIRRGYEVHLATAFADMQERGAFESLGIATHELPFERSGTAIAAETRVVLQMQRLLSELRPTLCHNVSIKPVIYGGILGRLYGIPTVNAVSGLGYSYIAQGLKAQLRRLTLNFAYSVAAKGAKTRVIVQNDDDWIFFRDELGVGEDKLVLIKGSGVDLNQFDATRPVSRPPLVVLPARMLVDKGIREFVAAARTLKAKGSAARFALVGAIDPGNRSGLAEDELRELVADGCVEYWGHRTDIPDVLAAAQIVCLPSYREGFPKVLLEAAAAGRAIVATDVPGCREIVRHGENGLSVPPRDHVLLAEALECLLADPARCAEMGRSGRTLAERYFSLPMVVDRTLQVYRELLEHNAEIQQRAVE